MTPHPSTILDAAAGEPAPASGSAVLERARVAVGAVEDPEMPPITIGELGMVLDVTLEGAALMVEVMPTFSGCPAIDYIGRDIVDAGLAVDGVASVDVRWRRDVAWGPERISDSG